MKTSRLPFPFALVTLCAGLSSAWAALPMAPAGIEIAAGKADRPAQDALGGVELIIGQAALKDAEGAVWKAADGVQVKAGDTISVGPDGRVRIQFKNGDALHLGGGALAQVLAPDQIRLWSGQAAIYIRAAEGGRPPLVVEAPGGSLEATGGKLGMSASEGKTVTRAYNNWEAWRDTDRYEAGDAQRDWRVLARWKEESGTVTSLAAGQRQVSGESAKTGLAADDEVVLTLATSPEVPALKQALQALDQGDAVAKPLFTRLQKAFPGNAEAAYHLGRIALEAEDNVEALRQWQLYSRLDPDGAEQLQIGPKLTLLIHETLKDEVRRAVAAESALSSAPPEPGTVAVLPFVNRGDVAQGVLSKGLTAMVISDLSKVPGVKVLERARLQKLIEEIQLSESGLVDEKSALRAGRLMKAEKLMLGDYQLQVDKK